MGFVTVIGIAGRNGIMPVSHWRHLEEEEGLPFSRELVIRGAEERLAPILMTGLTTALALLPIITGAFRGRHAMRAERTSPGARPPATGRGSIH